MENPINSSFHVCVGCGRGEPDFKFEEDLREGGWFKKNVGRISGVCNDCAAVWGEVDLLPHLADELALERAGQRRFAIEMSKSVFRSYTPSKYDAVCEGQVEGYRYLPLPLDDEHNMAILYVHAWRCLSSMGMLEQHPEKSALWRIKEHPESNGEDTFTIYSDDALGAYLPPFDPVLFRDLCALADSIPAGNLEIKVEDPNKSVSVPMELILSTLRTRNGTLHQIYDAVIEHCYNNPNLAANFIFRYRALEKIIGGKELPIELVGAGEISEMGSLSHHVYEVAAEISIQSAEGFDAQEFHRLLLSKASMP